MVQRFYGVKRWMYRTGRPGALARAMNRISAVQFSAGILSPARAVTLEVSGRRTGRLVPFPAVAAGYEGGRYLVSMLGRPLFGDAVDMTSGPGNRSHSRQLWGMAFDGIGKALRGLAQRLGGTRLGVLAIGRVVSPLQRQLYRRTGGRLSLTGRAPVLLLTTTGRRTGKARTVPLLYIRDGDHLVICNVNPGFERPNPWTLNLRAEPHAQVQIGRDTARMRAHAASEDELDRYWPQLTQMWPAYQAFYDKGGNRSVFVLEQEGQS
jgi:deazaflavin-dependent oxidoreductase (nitroreductase family)